MDEMFMTLVLRYARFASPDGVDENAELKGLGLDSKASVDLLIDLEDHYGVVFPDEYLTENTFKTPQTLWAAVRHLQAQKE